MPTESQHQCSGYSPDETLVTAYRRTGKLEVLAELFQRYEHSILKDCRKILRDTESSRDTAMEIFEKLTSALLSSEIGNFRLWLRQVVRNHCLEKLRQSKGKIAVGLEEDFDAVDEATLQCGDVEGSGWQEPDWIEKLREALAQLKYDQRRCIELFYFHKKRYREIASALEISPKQVKFNLQNGRNRLRTLLKRKLDSLTG